MEFHVHVKSIEIIAVRESKGGNKNATRFVLLFHVSEIVQTRFLHEWVYVLSVTCKIQVLLFLTRDTTLLIETGNRVRCLW